MLRLLAAAVISTAFAVPSAPAPLPSPHSAALFKWPPWLSIESPVNPYEPGTRGAVLLARARYREGVSKLADISGSAEGLVNGVRQSVPLRFDTTPWPNVYVLQRQWPTQGTWLLRITLSGTTTALVTIDGTGAVAGTRIPTRPDRELDLPRAVAMSEIDSTLAARARPVGATAGR